MEAIKSTLEKRLLFSGNQLLLEKCGDRYQIPSLDVWPAWASDIQHHNEIGTYSGHNCYAAEISTPINAIENYVWMPLKAAIESIDKEWFGIAARGYQTINWDKNHRYCGRCSQETIKALNSLERHCKQCKLSFFPKISPSIIVMIKKRNQILLARKSQFAPGIYALIAGFVEPGESLEDALHREVKEEVGISVKNIRYFGSQPWPFPNALMVAFVADYAGGEIKLADGELEAADWYDADHIPGLPASLVSISRQLVDSFLREQKQ